MSKKEEAISLRICTILKKKLCHISELEDRSFSAQIERFSKQGVRKWEKENGVINFQKPQQ